MYSRTGVWLIGCQRSVNTYVSGSGVDCPPGPGIRLHRDLLLLARTRRQGLMPQLVPLSLCSPEDVLGFSTGLDLCRLRYPLQVEAGIAQTGLPGFGALEIKVHIMLVCEANGTVNLNTQSRDTLEHSVS